MAHRVPAVQMDQLGQAVEVDIQGLIACSGGGVVQEIEVLPPWRG